MNHVPLKVVTSVPNVRVTDLTRSHQLHTALSYYHPRGVYYGQEDCALPIITPLMLHIHLLSKVSKVGPYNAAVA